MHYPRSRIISEVFFSVFYLAKMAFCLLTSFCFSSLDNSKIWQISRMHIPLDLYLIHNDHTHVYVSDLSDEIT